MTAIPNSTYPVPSTPRFQVDRLNRHAGDDMLYVRITDAETGQSEEFAVIDVDDQRRWIARQELAARIAVLACREGLVANGCGSELNRLVAEQLNEARGAA